jgi:hypothetical protein
MAIATNGFHQASLRRCLPAVLSNGECPAICSIDSGIGGRIALDSTAETHGRIELKIDA